MTQKDSNHNGLLAPGQVLAGRWEVLEHIATGGKGEVYRARQPKLEREVAIKVVSRELLEAYQGDEEEIAAELERFRREVLAMAATRHPNVLQVYDFEQAQVRAGGRERSLDYIVMEYIPGPTLAATIPEQGLAGQDKALGDWIRRYFLPVLEGVEHIHAQGIVHRDLKPSNVMLDGQVPKISDFGLVAGGRWQPVTRSHHVIGTLAYMAPEQYMELDQADQRADIYSLGKILYNAAVGSLGKETMKPLQAVSLPRTDTPFLKALDRVIRRATAEDPAQRYASVAQLREALLRLPGLAPAGREGRGKLALALGLAGLLALLLAWGVWYHFENAAPRPGPASAPPAPAGSAAQAPPPEIKGRDGATLRLVPAGKAPDGTPVAPFYLEATPVTNHQFVEFLKAVKERLVVADGVVKGEGKPWLLLGEVRKGVEPIVYEGGRFRIKDSTLAAHPVLKVTAYGAAAYAARNGRRLPTPAELARAAALAPSEAALPASASPAGDGQMASMHAAMTPAGEKASPAPGEPAYVPVTQYASNRLGIRGLSSHLGSWAREPGGRFLVVEGRGKALARPAWQGLDWVGFRTARDYRK